MIEKTLSYTGLRLSPEAVYEQMGYGNNTPDAAIVSETETILNEISTFLKPRFCFFVTDGALDDKQATLTVMGRELQIGRIISRQLRGSQRFVFFVATAGSEFEQFQHRVADEGDMVRVFIVDAIGSVLAERCADLMEEALENLIAAAGWSHTNRFSPGYCGWHVSQQQLLFPMFGMEKPCGVSLSESSLMTPIKSVSGVIGIGPDVRKLEYSCGLCDYKQCYKRKLPTKKRDFSK